MKANFKNDTVRKEFKTTLIIALVAVLLFGGIAAIRGIIYANDNKQTTIVVPSEDKPVSDNENPIIDNNDKDNEEDDKKVDNIKEETLEKPGTITKITKDSIGIACKDKVYYITKIKPSGKKIMLAKDYLNGIKKDSLLGTVVK